MLLKNSTGIDAGTRVEKSEEYPNGWKHVDAVPSDEVCVLYLGGNLTRNDRTANGYAKIIQEQILKDIDAPNIPVYSVAYDFGDLRKELGVLEYVSFMKYGRITNKKLKKHYNDTKQKEEIANPQYIDDIYKKFIEPRIFDTENKKKIDSLEASKNIRKLNIVTHCHGSLVALKLEELMQKKMEAVGFSKDDRDAIQKQLLIVNHTPACSLGVSKSTSISFCSLADEEVPLPQNHFKNFVSTTYKKKMESFKSCFLSEKKGNMFLVGQRFKSTASTTCEHNDVDYAPNSEHTPEGTALSFFAKNILSNGIKNSLQQDIKHTPLPNIKSLVACDRLFEKFCENGESLWNKAVEWSRISCSKINKAR